MTVAGMTVVGIKNARLCGKARRHKKARRRSKARRYNKGRGCNKARRRSVIVTVEEREERRVL